jgi:hypothetical protein
VFGALCGNYDCIMNLCWCQNYEYTIIEYIIIGTARHHVIPRRAAFSILTALVPQAITAWAHVTR